MKALGENNKIDSNLVDRIGNILIFLSKLIDPLYLTKALKLLYFIDEESMRETGVPVTGLKHEAWENGPVSREVFVEIHYIADNLRSSLDNYINVVKGATVGNDDSYKIEPKKDFDESEFSQYDIDIIDQVISRYGNKSAAELIDLVHAEGTPWSIVVKSNNLKEFFASVKKSSDFPVDLYPLTSNDEIKKLAYIAAEESNWFDKQTSE